MTKDRSHWGDDINYDDTKKYPSVKPLASMCSENPECQSFEYGGVAGPSSLKRSKLTPQDAITAWYTPVCFYEKL